MAKRLAGSICSTTTRKTSTSVGSTAILREGSSGVVSNRTGDLIAYGHVVVTTEDSTVLKTDSLAWFNRRQIIETDAPVEIVSPQGTVEGIGLISDANLRRIEIKEQVSGTTEFTIEGEDEEGDGQ